VTVKRGRHFLQSPGPTKLNEDRENRTIKAVAVVHNETSTGVTSRIDEVIARSIRPCCSSIRSHRSVRSTTGTTNGASTSP
jgi:hypothetical protein